jgi:hypothetical protein
MSEQQKIVGNLINLQQIATNSSGLITLALIFVLLGSIAGCSTQAIATPSKTITAVTTPQAETTNPPPLLSPTDMVVPTTPPDLPPVPVSFPSLTLPDAVDQKYYESTFRTGHLPNPERFTELPHYSIVIELSDDSDMLFGRQLLVYTNGESQPLEEIVFRLYPNHPRFTNQPAQERMWVDNVVINGEPVNPTFESSRTTMAVPLPQPLLPGEQITVEMDFLLQFLPDTEGKGFGPNTFYPLLAVYDQEDGWARDVGCGIDYVVSEPAMYLLKITTSPDQIMATTGIELSTNVNEDGSQTTTYIVSLVRDIAMSMSADYQVKSQEVDGVTINVFFNPTDEEAATKMYGFAHDAFRLFDNIFGAYPYTEFDLVVLPDGGGGWEFPTLSYVWYGRNPNEPYSESSTAHELAHQWWYGIVGNNNQEDPWLDEGFATYSEYLYFESVYGSSRADDFLLTEKDSYDRWAQGTGSSNEAVGQSVCDFGDDLSRFTKIPYIKGMLFLQTLRDTVGDDSFFAILREYYATNIYSTVTSQDLLTIAEQVSGMELEPLFNEWIGE